MPFLREITTYSAHISFFRGGDNLENVKLFEAIGLPEAWWPNCYVAGNGMVFTPIFDSDGIMTNTGREVYDTQRISHDVEATLYLSAK